MYDLFEEGEPIYVINEHVELATIIVGSWATKFVNGRQTTSKLGFEAGASCEMRCLRLYPITA